MTELEQSPNEKQLQNNKQTDTQEINEVEVTLNNNFEDNREAILEAQQANAYNNFLVGSLVTGLGLVTTYLSQANVKNAVIDVILAEISGNTNNNEQTNTDWLFTEDCDEEDEENPSNGITTRNTPRKNGKFGLRNPYQKNNRLNSITNMLKEPKALIKFLKQLPAQILNSKKFMMFFKNLSNYILNALIARKVDEAPLEKIVSSELRTNLKNPNLTQDDKNELLINDSNVKTFCEAIKEIVEEFVVALRKEKKEKEEEKKENYENKTEDIKKLIACILELCNIDDPTRTYLVNLAFNQQYISNFSFPNYVNVRNLLDLLEKNFNSLKLLQGETPQNEEKIA